MVLGELNVKDQSLSCWRVCRGEKIFPQRFDLTKSFGDLPDVSLVRNGEAVEDTRGDGEGHRRGSISRSG